MSHRAITYILLLLLTLPVSAAEVAFLEFHDKGQRVQLENGGRFYHVAIRYKGHWLQAHPKGGVSLVADLSPYGHRLVILRSEQDPEPDEAYVTKWLGRPFDPGYDWSNDLATYCSRLVAEALSVPPQPMSFSADNWKNHFTRPNGQPGISPDKLFAALLARGYESSCERDL